MIHLPGVLAAAGEVQRFCLEAQWQFCFIGGVAVQRWGEPRLTQDVDLTILAGFGHEERFTDALLRDALPCWRSDAREFALRHRVLLTSHRKRRGRGCGARCAAIRSTGIERSSPWFWTPDDSLITCSAEDLVVHKVFAARDLDWADVERVLIRQHGRLDLAQIRDELQALLELKGEPEAMAKFEQKIATVARRLS